MPLTSKGQFKGLYGRRQAGDCNAPSAVHNLHLHVTQGLERKRLIHSSNEAGVDTSIKYVAEASTCWRRNVRSIVRHAHHL